MVFSGPLNPARDFAPRIFAAIVGYGKEVFSSEIGHKYTWFLIPLFAPHVGAVVGTVVYVLFIGIHLNEDLKVGKSDKTQKRKIILAKFDEDELEEEFIQDYGDKIYTRD